ncbi:MAG: site-2 protease family protein [Lentisphaerae bacterium]|nr:site-2 protease family protein [Lentisphaerota bacterium]
MSSYRIATVWGIPIRLHVSLLFTVLLFMVRFGIFTGLLLEFGFVTSIVLHELGHSLVSIRKGCRVREITLMFIGGAAKMESIPTRPLDEFFMAVAGPAVSFVLGMTLVPLGMNLPLPPVRTVGINVVELIGWANLTILVFNLVPAFPMDGGRVLRASLTPKLGRLKATFVAARLGRIIAILFAVVGLARFNDGYWVLVFIAAFVYIAAGNEYRIVRMQERTRQAHTHWTDFQGEPVHAEDDDKVRIGPPPYAEGSDETEAEIRADSDRNPFGRFFQ